jgi:cytidylate kinase
MYQENNLFKCKPIPKHMIITISGMPGSGKTTTAAALAKKFNLKEYYMGNIRREVAKKKGITLNELNMLGETDPSTDKVVDDYLIQLGKTEDNFIAEGRTAYHFIPESIKIFMAVELTTGAERIFNDLKDKENPSNRNEAAGLTIQEQADLLQKRMDSDKLRYKKYYSIDVFNKDNYDLWIDTTDLTKEQVVEKIAEFIKSRE